MTRCVGVVVVSVVPLRRVGYPPPSGGSGAAFGSHATPTPRKNLIFPTNLRKKPRGYANQLLPTYLRVARPRPEDWIAAYLPSDLKGLDPPCGIKSVDTMKCRMYTVLLKCIVPRGMLDSLGRTFVL